MSQKKITLPLFVTFGIIHGIVIGISVIFLPSLENTITSPFLAAGIGLATSFSIFISTYAPTSPTSELFFGILKILGGISYAILISAIISFLKNRNDEIPNSWFRMRGRKNK